jgi:hypothetical protein
MEKTLFIFLLTILLRMNLFAQQIVIDELREQTNRTIKKDPDTTTWTWKRGGLISFNLSQGSLSNWAAGGDNFSLAVSSYFNYYFFYKKDRHSWDNNIDFNLGYVQTTSLGSRKNDDRFDYLSKYGYKIDTTGKWYVSGLFDFRTQFFDGFTYPNGGAVFSSTLLSPAYVVLSAGFDYKASEKFSVFISPLTSRSVIVANNYLAKQGSYGVDSGKHTLEEIGAFITVNYNYNLAKNINYKGRMDLFSNYKSQPQNINFFMTNQFSCKINKYFSATYSLDLIYDDKVRLFGRNGTSPALQVKSLISIGFLRNLNIRKS